VHYPSVVGKERADVWYAYVTDDYQSSPGQLTDAMLLDELDKAGIAPHITSGDVENLTHECRVKAD
jgi:hypothetical protein